MKKSLITSLIIIGSTAAHAVEFAPVFGDSYQADVAVAVISGTMNPAEDALNSDSTSGFEVSFTCPALKLEKHNIRQQLSYATSKDNGVTFKTFDISPHVMFSITDALQVGVGPDLGAVKVDDESDSDTVFTYGLGVSARYDITDLFFAGAELRQTWASDAELNGTKGDVSSSRALLKLGVQF